MFIVEIGTFTRSLTHPQVAENVLKCVRIYYNESTQSSDGNISSQIQAIVCVSSVVLAVEQQKGFPEYSSTQTCASTQVETLAAG